MTQPAEEEIRQAAEAAEALLDLDTPEWARELRRSLQKTLHDTVNGLGGKLVSAELQDAVAGVLTAVVKIEAPTPGHYIEFKFTEQGEPACRSNEERGSVPSAEDPEKSHPR